MHKSWVTALVVTTVLIGITVTPIRADELTDSIARQREMEKAQDRARSDLKNLQFTEEKTKLQLKEISRQIDIAKADLTSKELASIKAAKDVKAAEKELLTKQLELDSRQEALRKRVRAIYEEGGTNYLELLFQATNLVDFITRLEYFDKLIQNDQKLLTNIKEQTALITLKAKELEAKRDQAERLKQEAASAKKLLDNKKQEEQQSLAEIMNAQDELFTQIDKLEKGSKDLETQIRLLQANRSSGVAGAVSYWPLPDYHTVSSPFGWRIHPITKTKRLHTGTDIPAPTGTPIYSAGTGTVIFTGWSGAYGNTVIVDHGGGLSTVYPHQSKIAAINGQDLKAGELVGYVGSTGWSTGPHLHFEVRVNGNPTDSLAYFR